jgi:hypothetical protein
MKEAAMAEDITLTSTEAAYVLGAVQFMLERGGLEDRDRAVYELLKCRLASELDLSTDVLRRLDLLTYGRA